MVLIIDVMDMNTPLADPAIDLRGVGVLREGRWILRDVGWRVGAGACVGILGPNGSGKSTLARILSGHLFPSAGVCSVLGARFGESNLPRLRRRIRLVQPAGPYDVDPSLTTRDVVLTGFFSTLHLYDTADDAQRRRADAVISQIGLAAVADHPYRTLSSGERVRALIGRALVTSPSLLLLDEPTAGMDLVAREQVLATIQRLHDRIARPHRPTIVLITHHTEELPPAVSQILLLDNGQPAAAGPVADVLRDDVLSRVYRFPVTVHQSGGRYYTRIHPGAWEGIL